MTVPVGEEPQPASRKQKEEIAEETTAEAHKEAATEKPVAEEPTAE